MTLATPAILATPGADLIANLTCDQLQPGHQAQFVRTLTLAEGEPVLDNAPGLYVLAR